jgi:glyoxylase-like metal-dependent hydrolase (beta-lactamase superfamily II)
MTRLAAFHVLDTGGCITRAGLILASESLRERIRCPSLVALLRHPERGWILWDTGYAPRMLEATRRLPFRAYRWATPLRLRPGQEAVARARALGIAPEEIRYVILSHFHADHMGGLRDFPEARIIAPRAGYDAVRGLDGIAALSRAYIPALLPGDFAERSDLVGAPAGAEVTALGATHDVFGDGALRLVSLPGHARGQWGMLAEAPDGPVLLAADGCWHTRAVTERRPPNRLLDFLPDSPAAAVDTLHRLADFHEAHPEVRLIPSHCPQAAAREGATERPA